MSQLQFAQGEELATESGARVRLRACLTRGGAAGSVWATDRAGVVAKLYKERPHPNTAVKLRWMAAHPPRGGTASGRPLVAWPADLVFRSGQLVGFLMPQAPPGCGLTTLVTASLRLTDRPTVTWRDLLAVAENLARGFEVVHGNGAVVGDVRDENVMVGHDNHVTLIDTDSFQVTDRQAGRTYVCEFGVEEYQSPQALMLPAFDARPRSESDDRFGLGVLIYQLLLCGHPFIGNWTGTGGNRPDLRRFVLENHCVLRPGSLMKPWPALPALDTLPPELRDLFTRCFLDGHAQPDRRPSAEEWRIALTAARPKVKACSAYPARHYFHKAAKNCPWCALVARGAPDLFGAARPPAPAPSPIPRAFAPKPKRSRRLLMAGVVAAVLLVALAGLRAVTRDREPGAPRAGGPSASVVAPTPPPPVVRGVGAPSNTPRVGKAFTVEVDTTGGAGTPVIEYRLGTGEWTRTTGRQVTLTPAQAGALEAQFRAVDEAKQASEPVARSWVVVANKRPALTVVDTGPPWPVPGGQWRARVRVADEDPVHCRVRYTLVGEPPPRDLPAGATEVVLDALPATSRVVTLVAIDDLGAESEPVTVDVPVAAVKPAAATGVPPPRTRNAVGMAFVSFPAGAFVMGAPRSADADRPLHGVQFDRPFLLGQSAVTERERRTVFGLPDRPGDDSPWAGVTAAEAERFCHALSSRRDERSAGRTYRVPTEAEWEYACRAGRPTVKGFEVRGDALELCLSRGDYWAAPIDGRAATTAVVYRGRGSAARQFADPGTGGLRVVCELVPPLTGGDLFFNHADLRGWSASGKWAIKQRVLTGQADGGEAALYSADAYASFKLSFAVKVTDAAAFGVRVRSAGPTVGPVFLFPGSEYKEDHGFGTGVRKVHWGSTRDLPDYKWVNDPARPLDVRPGEYNIVTLTVRDRGAVVTVNGRALPEIDFKPGLDEATKLRATGPIGFLLSGSGEASVKDVALEPLP